MAFKRSLDVDKGTVPQNGKTDIAQNEKVNMVKYGGVAQLGERLNGIQEVNGSIPSISTTQKARKINGFPGFLSYMGISKSHRLDPCFFSSDSICSAHIRLQDLRYLYAAVLLLI